MELLAQKIFDILSILAYNNITKLNHNGQKTMHTFLYLFSIVIIGFWIFHMLALFYHMGGGTIPGMIFAMIYLPIACYVIYHPITTLKIVMAIVICGSLIKLSIDCFMDIIKYIRKLFTGN